MSGIKFRASFLKKFSSDFLYTVSAVVVLNIVQQMVIQPYVNRVMGAEYLGNMLYYLGITYVFPQMSVWCWGISGFYTNITNM